MTKFKAAFLALLFVLAVAFGAPLPKELRGPAPIRPLQMRDEVRSLCEDYWVAPDRHTWKENPNRVTRFFWNEDKYFYYCDDPDCEKCSRKVYYWKDQ